MKRKRRHADVRPVQDVFERTMVELCRDLGYHRRYRPAEIDLIVRSGVEAFASTVEELGDMVEAEEWDEIAALATQTETRRALRAMRGLA